MCIRDSMYCKYYVCIFVFSRAICFCGDSQCVVVDSDGLGLWRQGSNPCLTMEGVEMAKPLLTSLTYAENPIRVSISKFQLDNNCEVCHMVPASFTKQSEH